MHNNKSSDNTFPGAQLYQVTQTDRRKYVLLFLFYFSFRLGLQPTASRTALCGCVINHGGLGRQAG